MNQGCVNSRLAPTSAVPVLPATGIPASAAAVPVPSSTTRLIIAVSCSAVSGFMTVDCRSGWMRSFTRPSLRTIAVREARLHQPATVRDRRRDLGHLQRRGADLTLEPALADRDAADVEAVLDVARRRR